MAFTPAHVAAVLPLGRRLAARGSVLAAPLVIGSMAPDFPTYLPSPVTRDQTHSVVGVLTWSAIFGLLCLVLWDRVFCAPARDLAPSWVRRRLARRPRLLRLADLPAAYGMLVVGGLTHIFWDDFTHENGWFVLRSSLLNEHLGRWPVFEWLQLLTSVIGCAVVLGVELHVLASRSPAPYAPSRLAHKRALWAGLGVAYLVGFVVGSQTSLHPHQGYQVVKSGLVSGTVVLVLAGSVLAGLWWRAGSRSSTRV